MRLTARLLWPVMVGVGAVSAMAFFLNQPEHVEKPIIAQLYAEPDRFAGRTVEIYGLVVRSDANSEFLLQDVSQRPLRVIGAAAIGDQLTVIGKFHSLPHSVFLAAEKVVVTKVLGGGGCC